MSPEETLRPRKVLVLHNRYQQRGGEDGVFEQEVKLLRSKGHQVIEYLETNEGIGETNPLQSSIEAIWARRTFRRLRELIHQEQPDIAHFHNTFAKISPAAYYACRQSGVPVVQTLHNFRIGCLNAGCMIGMQTCERCLPHIIPVSGIIRGCYRNSILASAAMAAITSAHKMLGTYHNQVDAYIALTEFARRTHVRAGIPEQKIHVKPNFTAEQIEPFAQRQDYALFVGRLSPEKGITTLLKAWAMAHTPFPLKIAGDGPSAPEVANGAARIPGVEWLGSRPHSEIVELMRHARFLVVPSVWYESFGLCIVEAFSVGLPCIVSGHGSMQEIVEHGSTGLHFQPADPGDLAAKVQWMVEHPEEREQMGHAAYQRYVQCYTPGQNYKLLMEVYKAAMTDYRECPTGGLPRPNPSPSPKPLVPPSIENPASWHA